MNRADEALIEVLPSETVIESANLDKLRLTNSEIPNWEGLNELLERAIKTLRSEVAPNTQRLAAIADIRKVKAALHKFTNERWDGLVRARNVLVVTAFLAALFTYILVAITILAEVSKVKIEEAMVFYFVGAIVGLFSRIYDEKKTNNVIDDCGLTMARIIVTPLLSGLAALVGVFLVTI